MRYLSHEPSGPLAEHVGRLWSLSDTPAHTHERIVPSGTLQLVVNLGEDAFRIHSASGLQRLSGITISGAYRRPFVVDTRHHASIVGVHFEPGGAAAVLGVPPGELTDRHVDLEDLWGIRGRELREQLCAAPTTARRFAILDGALRARLVERRRHPAVQLAIESLGRPGASVGAVAARAGLGARRFHEIVRAELGLGPKAFDRVRRLQRVLARIAAPAAPEWARVAIEHGYCDQSHLIREVVALSGVTPAELRARRDAPVKQHHVVVADEASDSSNPKPPSTSMLHADEATRAHDR